MLLLLTNVTRDPAATVSDLGETPLDVMVIVAPLGDGVGVGVGVGDGVGVGAGDGDGEGVVGVELSLPPHAPIVKVITSHRDTEAQRTYRPMVPPCLRDSVAWFA
jgi:hypothetical protein